MRPGVALTLGSKLEYDTFGGWGVLPSARAIWEASPGQRLWAAVSRTHRTPSNADRTVQLNLGVMPGEGLPILLATKGNPNFRSERLVQVEVGHRIRLGSTASFETTVFSGSYDDLSTSEPFQPTVELTPAPPHVLAGAMLDNLQRARASGVELNARWNPLPRWEIETSYSRLHLTADPDPASLDALRRNSGLGLTQTSVAGPDGDHSATGNSRLARPSGVWEGSTNSRSLRTRASMPTRSSD